MAINFRILKSTTVALAIFFALVSFAEAQSRNTGAGYFLDPDSEEPRFIQRLVWSGDEFTLRYEVIIERREGASYRRFLQRFTADTFIEVSMPPAHYRFCVIPYDLLNRPGDSTDWVYIEVRHALKPQLVDTSQELIKEGKKTYFYLDIYADNIDNDAEIFLRASNGRIINHEGLEFFDDGGFRLTYDSSLIKTGEYEVYVKNPGGLEGSLGIVYVGPESNFKINFGAAYMPVLQISGETINWTLAVAGAAARISVVYNFSDFYLGPELTASFYKAREKRETEDGNNLTVEYEVPLQTFSAELSLLLGKTSYQKSAFNIRLGGGYNMIMIQDEKHGFFTANFGVSFFLFLMKNFFFEFGVDYAYQFNENNTSFLRPWAGLGLQF